MQLVVVVLLVFCTPRMTMQRWEDSITTPTPRGFRTSEMARATCLVRRSCTCSLRENISARRASFDRPRTRRSGMYPMCICCCVRPMTISSAKECRCWSYPAVERHHVVFTQREHLDILDNNQLIMIFVEDCGIDKIPDVFFVSLCEIHHGLGVSFWCLP